MGSEMCIRDSNSTGEVRNHFTTRVISLAVRYALFAFITFLVLYLGIGAVLGASSLGIIGGLSRQLLPIWISMVVIFTASIIFKRKLGLFGKLFDSPIGMIGFAIVIFWVLITLLAGGLDLVVTHDELSQVSGMKNKLPGTPVRGAEAGE